MKEKNRILNARKEHKQRKMKKKQRMNKRGKTDFGQFYKIL